MSLRERLKLETAALHELSEAEFGALRPGFSQGEYVTMLSQLYGWLAPTEAWVQAHLPTPFREMFAARQRVASLAADLEFFGVVADSLACVIHRSPRSNPFEAIGAMYVIEGSALGGHIIARHLKPILNLSPTTGARYFSGNGQDVMAGFRAFCGQLESVPAEQANHVVGGAALAFATLLEWLRAWPRSSVLDANSTHAP